MIRNKNSISVIIPVYNCEKYLEQALCSIQNQTIQPDEIIVIDDGSTDRSAHIVKRFNGIKYTYQNNHGVSVARNRGIRLAKGQILAFLDADDLWPENKLETQMQYFKKDPLIEVVMGHVQCLRLLKGIGKQCHFEEFRNPFFTFLFGAVLFRRSIFDKIGFLDEGLRFSEDVDWFLRAKESGACMLTLQQTTLLYRLHETNMVRAKDIRNQGMFAMLKKSISRKREIEA